MRSLARIIAVARVTLLEATRRRVVVMALAMGAAFLALYGLGLHFVATVPEGGLRAAEEMVRRGVSAQMLYMALIPASFIVAFAAVFASVATISGDVESGVAYPVLARPIRRGEIVVGKFLGLATLLVPFALFVNGGVIALAAAILHAPVREWPPALALLALEPLLLLVLALVGSTRLPTLANGVLCTAAYGIGFIAGFIEQIGGLIRNGTMTQLGVVVSLLTPLDAIHRKATEYLLPGGLLFGSMGSSVGVGASTAPSVWMLGYAVGYIVVLVALAAASLRGRDL